MDARRKFRRVLVPVDFTPRNRRALRVAADLAAGPRASLVLLHVIETLSHIPAGELREFYGQLEEDARRKLRSLAKTVASRRRRLDLEILYGKRAEVIVRHAAETGIDLIVLSSHEVDLKRPAHGLGTISHQVGILAPCSVLLVK